MINRTGQAEWAGDLKNGTGRVHAGGLESAYSFASRFEDGNGTTPEALIAVAHAGCFSMALSLILGEKGYTPEGIWTTATVSLDPGALEITGVTLETRATVPGLLDGDEFERIAEEAKENCPVSKALRATEIRLRSAELVVA